MADDSNSILSILENSRGYDMALLTTFNFEIDFFEKAILGRLIKNDIRKVSVYIDSKELAKAVSESSSVLLGQRYVVNPVEMHGSFHPKIILLLGERKARLIVGSGNLKMSGYYINNEVFGCLDYSADRPDYRGIIYNAIRYFEEFDKCTPGLDADLLKEIRKYPYYRPSSDNERVHFIGNGSSSILQQVSQIITGNVEEIRIAVPYYDNGLMGLNTIRETWPSASCQLFLQHKWSTYQNLSGEELVENVFEFIGSKENNNGHFYHGKILFFRTVDSEYLLYGSSNCTQSALTKAKEEGGNYECDILLKGNKSEFESFYSQFIKTDKRPEGHPMVHTSSAETNFYFRYGILKKRMTLHLGFVRSFKRALFSYRDIVIPWRRSNGEIVLEIDADQVPGGIFDLDIEYDDQKEVVKCWCIDHSAIDLFRIRDLKTDELTDDGDFGEGDKFRDDYEKLLRAMGSCNQDWIEIRQSIVPYMAAKEEEEGADRSGQDGLEEDFIVNVNLSDEDFSAYRQFCTMERLRNKATEKYLHSLPLFFCLRAGSGSTDSEGKEQELERKKTEKITQDKRFVRFVKRIVRNLTDPMNVEAATRDHYTGIVAVLFSIFDDPKNEGIFDAEYMIKTRCELILALLKKLDPDRDASRLWISKIIGIILNNHFVSETFDSTDKKDACEQSNRRVLRTLEDKYRIRNCYEDFFVLEDQFDNNEYEEKRRQAIAYLEQLYGYQDIRKIEEDLRKRFGDLCGIVIEKDVAIVDIVSEITDIFLKPDSKVVRELRRYSANVQKLSSIVITIRNPKKMSGSSIIKAEHKINLTYFQWSHSILRANGQTQNYPTTYFHL